MITVTKIFEFAAAHKLPNHEGLCKNLHGHNYRLEVTISGPVNISTGMVIDFGDLKKNMQPALKEFDHAYLNDHPDLPQPPTAENMVKYFKNYLFQILASDYQVEKVRIWETSTSFATWRRD